MTWFSRHASGLLVGCTILLLTPLSVHSQDVKDAPPAPIGPRGCGGLYPEISRRLHEEGVVTVSAIIRTDGALRDIQVENSSAKIRLDEAALECVSAWTYVPAKKAGVAVEAAIHPQITWKLDSPTSGTAQRARVEDLTKSLADQPQNPELLLKRADFYMANAQPTLAIADYERVLTLMPGNAGIYLLLARAHAAGKGGTPLDTLNRGLMAFSRDVILLKARAEFFLRSQNTMENARADLETALSIAPGDTIARYMLYSTLMGFGRNDEARAQLDMVLQSDHKDAGVILALHVRSRTLLKEKAYLPAVADLDRLADLQPTIMNFNESCWYLAVANVALEKAVEYCARGLKLGPQNANLMDSQGFAYFRMGKFAESRDMYGKALAINPKIPSALYMGGLAKKRLGDDSGDGDIASGKRLESGIAERYAGYGVLP